MKWGTFRFDRSPFVRIDGTDDWWRPGWQATRGHGGTEEPDVIPSRHQIEQDDDDWFEWCQTSRSRRFGGDR